MYYTWLPADTYDDDEENEDQEFEDNDTNEDESFDKGKHYIWK